MDPKIIYYIILTFVTLDYLFGRFLSYLNTTCWSDTLPIEVKNIYDEDEYRRSQQYLRTNTRFGMVTSSFNYLLIMLMLLLGGFALVDEIVRSFTNNPVWMALAYFGILGLASDLLSTPFEVYDTFVIEERFGFNKTTPRTFILDKLKGWLLAVLVGGGLLAVFVWVYTLTGAWFWLIVWGIITLFMIFMAMFYSNLIVPLFNRQTPLEEGELREAINEFARRAGFRLKNIYVIDGSRRSTKANAYFTGLGPKKRIVLYDTLIHDHSTDEIVAVLAHEVGHYKKRHTLTGTLLGILQTGIMLFILSFFIDNPALSKAFGAEQPSFHLGILAFGILYSPISLLLGIVMNVISRRNEYAADRFAGSYGLGRNLKSALVRLSVKNLSNLRPHPAVVFVNYSHPPLLQRLQALEEFS